MSLPSPNDPTLPGLPHPHDPAADEATIRRAALRLGTPPAADATLFASAHSESDSPKPPAVPLPAAFRYQTRETLGRGGMGLVEAALDPQLGREVAIKTMLNLQDDHDRRRFVEEAQVTGQLEHPNIVPVHELGIDPQKGPFLVMKRVRGRSLKDVLHRVAAGESATWHPAEIERSGVVRTGDSALCVTHVSEHPAPPPAAASQPSVVPAGAPAEKSLPWLLNVFVHVCDAVAYAHARGVIHRDLKPDNIMVGEFGEVLVMDWGLAKVLGRPETQRERLLLAERNPDADAVARTMDGEIVGTPMYMPPEQALGKVDALDERSDVYSLGAILYEIISLNRPFDGETVWSILQLVGEGALTAPHRRNRAPWDVPHELEAVVLKAMSRAPADRYRSATDLKADVEAWFSGRRLSAVEYSAWDLLVKFARRHRAAVLTGAAAFLLLVLAVVLFVLNVTRARADALREKERAEQERSKAEQERSKAEQAEKDAHAQERLARLRVAEGLVLQGNSLLLARRWLEAVARYEEARAQFEQLGVAADAADRGVVEAYRLSPPALYVLDDFHGPMHAVAVSPDGCSCVVAGTEDAPRLFDLRTGLTIRMFDEPLAKVSTAEFSPDGRLLLVGHETGQVSLWETATGKLVRRDKASELRVACAVFSPDGARFATTGQDGMIRLWDTARGEILKTVAASPRDVNEVAFSPDGRRLAASCTDDVFRVFDAATLAPAGEWRGSTGYGDYVAWTPDGRRAVATTGSGAIDVWDMEKGVRLHVLSGHGPYVGGVAVTADGCFAISAGGDQSVRIWDLRLGKEVRALYGHVSSVGRVALTPDGRQVVSVSEDGTVRVWEAETNPDREEMRGHFGPCGRMRVSADGRRLVSCGTSDGSLRVWDLAGLREIASVHGRCSVRDVAWIGAEARAASVGDDGLLHVWDLAAGKEEFALAGNAGLAMCVAVAPDGRRALTGDQAGWVRLWDLEKRSALWAVHAHASWVSTVLFHPDGKRCVSASSDRTAKLFDLEKGDEIRTFTGNTSMVVCADLSPDGRVLATASADHHGRLFDVESGRLLHDLTGHSSGLHAVCFSPDGRHVVSTGDDSSMRLWDVGDGRELHSFAYEVRGKEMTGSLAFAPDGRLVLAGADGVIAVRDFRRPASYREFAPRLDEARKRLARDANDAAGLAELGRWYAFRGAWDWCAEMFERARAHGAEVDPIMLFNAYARMGRWDDALREIERVRGGAGKADPALDFHLRMLSAGLTRTREAAAMHDALVGPARPLEMGRTEGKLDASSPLDGKWRLAVYRMAGRTGMRWNIRFASTAFRPTLVLVTPTHGQISTGPAREGESAVSMEINLPEDGEYVMIGTSAAEGAEGAFAIELGLKGE